MIDFAEVIETQQTASIEETKKQMLQDIEILNKYIAIITLLLNTTVDNKILTEALQELTKNLSFHANDLNQGVKKIIEQLNRA